jgi:phosphoribosylformylglycinamidine cyclo-ligase
MSERGPIQDVNIELGDDVSRMLYEASKQTHQNRPGLLVEFHESFSGARAIPLGGLPDAGSLYMNMGFDGIGTKVEVAERLDDHSVAAFDLFAMVCDDAVVRGAEPVAIGSILDVRQLEDNERTRNSVRQLADGYIKAAAAAGVVVVNGEVAELGDRIGGYRYSDTGLNYNWGAAVMWLAHKERFLTGRQIQPGDSLIGLAESGFRSNGITDVRKAMLENYGSNWHEQHERSLGTVSLGKLVQRPSTIYSKFVSELTGGYDIRKEPKAEITGVAHITGGGQPSKLGRMLEPSGLGAIIDSPIDPPEIMTHVQMLRGFDDRKAYGKWRMGPGMIIATPEPRRVLAEAAKHGISAQEIGLVNDQSGIKILNRGIKDDAEWLTF